MILRAHARERQVSARGPKIPTPPGSPVKWMLGAVAPSFYIEDVHRDVLDKLLDGNGVAAFRARNAR